MAGIITIRGVEYGSSQHSIMKLRDMAKLVPHIWKSVDPKPTRYGSYIATVINEDNDEEHLVYMPKYIVDRALPGKTFIYSGLVEKTNGSGHSYHQVDWCKE